jgi:hypothetical protein
MFLSVSPEFIIWLISKTALSTTSTAASCWEEIATSGLHNAQIDAVKKSRRLVRAVIYPLT